MSSATCPYRQKPSSKVSETLTHTHSSLCSTQVLWGFFSFWFCVRLNSFCLFCAAAGEKMIKDIRPGVPFEPTYIYKLLTLIKSSLSEKVRGLSSAMRSVCGSKWNSLFCERFSDRVVAFSCLRSHRCTKVPHVMR